jgi:hypothetical protein
MSRNRLYINAVALIPGCSLPHLSKDGTSSIKSLVTLGLLGCLRELGWLLKRKLHYDWNPLLPANDPQ